jgi:hypothetical protein
LFNGLGFFEFGAGSVLLRSSFPFVSSSQTKWISVSDEMGFFVWLLLVCVPWWISVSSAITCSLGLFSPHVPSACHSASSALQ